jgi:hypothetical protein
MFDPISSESEFAKLSAGAQDALMRHVAFASNAEREMIQSFRLSYLEGMAEHGMRSREAEEILARRCGVISREAEEEIRRRIHFVSNEAEEGAGSTFSMFPEEAEEPDPQDFRVTGFGED